MRIPQRITAGDQVDWTELAFVAPSGTSIAAPDYQLRFSLRGPIAAAKLDLDGQSHGTSWAFQMTGDQTAALNTGVAQVTWFWSASATRGTERSTAGAGRLLVLPNLAALPGVFDGRSTNEQALESVEKQIDARAKRDLVAEYTIGSRSLKKEPLQVLLDLRRHYRKLVRNERKAQAMKNGGGNPGSLGVRFTS
jgi:hypothetical protein